MSPWFRLTRSLIASNRKSRSRIPALTVEPLESRLVPSATIAGKAFEDFNANGIFDTTATLPNASQGTVPLAIDRGVPGVVIRAFDSAGNPQGLATTDAVGNYSFTATGTGPYRIEETLTPGYTPGPVGPTAADSSSTIAFAPDGGTTTINFGLVKPGDYSQNAPDLVTNKMVFGDSQTNANGQGPNVNTVVLVNVPFTAGTTDSLAATLADYQAPTAHSLAVPFNQIGTTNGVAYNSVLQTVYVAAYQKKHAGFGPDGTGAIYQTNTTGTTASLFIDLNAVLGAGTAGANPHNTLDYDLDEINPTATTQASFDGVGKVSLGGMDVSPDGKHLYVMNLANRTLYDIPINPDGTANVGGIRGVAVPLASVPGATGVGGDDVRPFAVKFYQGKIYVGLVNTAESTTSTPATPTAVPAGDPSKGDPTKLFAAVYTVDPTTFTFSAAPVFGPIGLNYNRGQGFVGETSANWLPWVPTWRMQVNAGNDHHESYAQPMLTGIAFDADGNMVLGLRDRYGDQTANYGKDNPLNAADPNFRGIGTGDLLRAFINTPGNPASGWGLESNATNPNNAAQFTGGVGNNRGPGGGAWYYQQDLPGSHDKLSSGGVVQIPGYPDIVTTSTDPTRKIGDVRSSGLRWYDDTTGRIDKAYELYAGTAAGVHTGTFGKSNGIGNLAVLIDSAPIELGDRVWLDTNGNGIQDANEPGIQGVTVHLYDATGAVLLGTTVTDANGNYYFNAGDVPTGLQPNTDYVIKLDRANDYTGAGALTGLVVTGAFAGGNTSIDSNGLIESATSTTATVTTGAAGLNNHTIDFGFTTPVLLSLGNFVFNDANNNGIFDSGEQPLSGVTVTLLQGATVIGSMPTTGTGNYQFDNLTPGTYTVRVTPPAGFVSSTGTNGSASGLYEPGVSGTQDSEDHGTTAGAFITATVNLTATGNPDNGGTANLRQDFGLFQTQSFGDFVWNDANNNGAFDAGESGISGVTVNLLDSANMLVATATTNGQGGYLFTNLVPGQYRAVLPASNFVVGGPLAGLVSSSGTNGSASGPFEPPTTPTNNQDHGNTNAGAVQGPLVTLSLGTAPTGETTGAPGALGLTDPALDANSDRSQDFGLYQPLSIGNFVWNDANNNGTFDGGEQPLTGVTVTLLQGATVIGSMPTTGTGNYQFNNLTPGTYTVRVTPPAGYVSSTGSLGAAGSFEPGVSGIQDNQDHGTTAGAFITATVTLTAAGNPDNSGTANLRQDFGLFQPVSVGDFAWLDGNGNGIQDGEPGLAGVVVTLYDAVGTTPVTQDVTGNAINPITTTGTGAYLFGNLSPGQYTVKFTPPANYVPTLVAAAGSTPSNDSNGLSAQSAVLAGGQSDITLDSGFILPIGFGNSSLAGNVYADLNNNGLRDPGEPGIGGTTVQLVNPTTGTVLATTTTLADGTYRFNGLPAATYRVVETQPAGYLQGINAAGSASGTPVPVDTIDNITLGSGVDAINYNFGEIGSNLTGTVFLDLNKNGTQQSGESGMNGVTVQLRDSENRLVATTLTNGTGGYQFLGIPAGNYTVTEVTPRGYGTSTPVTLAETVPANTTVINVNFGNTLGSLSGTVYRDFNMDGAREPNAGNPETGILNITVTLTGTDVYGTPINRTTATDGAGNYSFPFLLQGSYAVTETQPPRPTTLYDGYFDGFDNVGSLGGSNPVKNQLATALGAGQDGTVYNFGEIPPADPFGYVYYDANNNGTLDAGESGIPNVAVTIAGTAFAGTALSRPLTAADLPGGSLTILTNANGRWEFPVIPPGIYSVVERQPAGYDDGLEQNADPNGPNNVVVGNDRFDTIVLQPFPVRGPFNFGETAVNASVAGSVYVDSNNNAWRDPGELGIPGVPVQLTGVDNTGLNVNTTAVTDANGNFAFLQMRPGSYRLTETQPVGYVDGQERAGTAGGAVGNDTIGGFALGANQAAVTYLFGELGVDSAYVSKNQFLASSPTMTLLPATPGSGVALVNYPGDPASTNRAWVIQAYQSLLHRTPGTAEATAWTNLLLQGVSQATVVAAFRSSYEFAANNGAWIRNLYRDLLHREASAGEVNVWVNALAGGMSGDAAVAGITGSLEYLQPQWTAWVAQAYQTLLHRTPGAGETSVWVNALQGGLTRESMLAMIASGSEYASRRAGTNTSASWVSALYGDLLQRTAGPGEINLWSGLLASGSSRYTVALLIAQSSEYRRLQGPALVQGLYQSLLRRTPGSAEVAMWVDQLANGMSPATLTSLFLSSEEYYQRALRNP